MNDSSAARSKLEFLQKEFLGDVHQLVERLEAVARLLDGSVKQLASDRAAAKHDMRALAGQLVGTAAALEGERSRPANLVSLSKEGRASVFGVVDAAVNGSEAVRNVKAEIQRLAGAQAALLAQLQEKEVMDWDWKRVGLVGACVVAACLVAATVGGLVVAWLVKPTPLVAVSQDLPVDPGIQAAPSGQKSNAGKQQR